MLNEGCGTDKKDFFHVHKINFESLKKSQREQS